VTLVPLNSQSRDWSFWLGASPVRGYPVALRGVPSATGYPQTWLGLGEMIHLDSTNSMEPVSLSDPVNWIPSATGTQSPVLNWDWCVPSRKICHFLSISTSSSIFELIIHEKMESIFYLNFSSAFSSILIGNGFRCTRLTSSWRPCKRYLRNSCESCSLKNQKKK
jgi:hypothetical protein